MEIYRLEAPRSSNKIRTRTLSGSIDSKTIVSLNHASCLKDNHVESLSQATELHLDFLQDNSGQVNLSSNSKSQQSGLESKFFPSQDNDQSCQRQIRRNMSAPVLDLDNNSMKKHDKLQDKENQNVLEERDEVAESNPSDKNQLRPSICHSRATGQRAMSDVGTSASGRIEWVEEIDALKMMKDGTSFLKYGKWGAPHFRPFRLSQDNTKIIWSSKNKSKDSTQIDIKRIDKVLLGQNTSNFQRHASPELARASFSVVYDKSKTLDVVAKNQTEHNCWIQGLNALIEAARKDELEQLTELIVRLRMMRTEFKTNNDDKFQKPTYSKERAVKDYQGLWKVYTRMTDKSRLPKLLGSEEFEIVTSKLETLKDQLDAIDTKIAADDLFEIDFMLWQASVEIESINNIISALKL